ncbi:phage minor head protein [Citreimonas salinaria]|uniref:Phage Mu protein F like protein n=1 Tax=Citreimonas salinaria TaxID=321339 RepID=A0A1H3KU33_9RHOB|nr:phage minor head protein [Citreimonas salinaria]SDY55258.1 Phage Mu protein F like protein [Citreimonas salinaria]
MAEPTVATAFRRPFAEQVAAFRLRLGNLLPTSTWRDVWKAQHDRAFMVAGATKADLLADLARAVDKAISEGTTLEEFRRDFREIVERRGWHGWTGEGTVKGEAWRTKVIYETNMRTSYMAGRWAQLQLFPIWIYRHGGSVEPRLHHLAWDGLILPREHPFWQTHFPPNGWGCSCFVIGARNPTAAVRRGGKPEVELQDGWDVLDRKTGEPPGIGKGWGYAPGATVAEDVQRLADVKREALPEALGEALGRWGAEVLDGDGPKVPEAP